MKGFAAAIALAGLAASASAQVSPAPSFDDPRLQTVSYDPSRPVRLVAFPDATLTVMLLPGEQIQRVALADPLAFDARTTAANDSLTIRPLRAGAATTMLVDTPQRRYEFELATGTGLDYLFFKDSTLNITPDVIKGLNEQMSEPVKP